MEAQLSRELHAETGGLYPQSRTLRAALAWQGTAHMPREPGRREALPPGWLRASQAELSELLVPPLWGRRKGLGQQPAARERPAQAETGAATGQR